MKSGLTDLFTATAGVGRSDFGSDTGLLETCDEAILAVRTNSSCSFACSVIPVPSLFLLNSDCKYKYPFMQFRFMNYPSVLLIYFASSIQQQQSAAWFS